MFQLSATIVHLHSDSDCIVIPALYVVRRIIYHVVQFHFAIYRIINSVYTISKYIASYLGRWTLYCMIMQPSAMVVTHYVHTTVKELHGIAMA